jgi:hypothetical protein
LKVDLITYPRVIAVGTRSFRRSTLRKFSVGNDRYAAALAVSTPIVTSVISDKRL